MKKTIFASIVVICLGCTLLILGTFSPDENIPTRFSFNTYSRYSDELNSFFNRTEATPQEDAKNKLIESYRVAGYAITPIKDPPSEGYPVIIWMHGFGVSSDLQMNYPRQFAKAGFFTIALDQPGHGWSGGYWDMGLETLLGVYSTIEWLINDSNFKNVIDTTRIGISGHSMGGIAATRAGIFDNWINPKTSKIIGTGRISSCVAIFCWDDSRKMAEGLMSSLGLEQVWSHPTTTDMLTHWRWLSNYDPSILEEEFRIRSVSNFINSTNINNYCLIIGGNESPAMIESECHILANSTIGTTGVPQIPWDLISDTIHTSSNHTWSFGDVMNDSARRLVLVPGIDHFEEAINFDVLQNTTYWFNESMECVGISADVPNDFQALYFLKMTGWILVLVGSLCAIFPTLLYISSSRIGLKPKIAEVAPNINEKEKKYYFCVYAVIPVFFISVSGLINLYSITHFWMFDLFVIPKLLLSALLLFIPILALVLFEKKHHSYSYSDLGLNSTFKDLFKNAFTPLIAIGFWIMLFNSVAWIFQVPLLLPRPLEIDIYLDFILLLGILLLFNFVTELLFRGLFQTKIQQKKGEKASTIITIVKSGILSGVCLGLGFGTNFLVTIFGLFVQQPILILALYISVIGIFFILGVISATIYCYTGSVISSTTFNTLIMALLMSGKLLLVYA